MSNAKSTESDRKPAPLREVLHDGAMEIQQTLGHMAHESRGAIGHMVQEGRTRVEHALEEGHARVDSWSSDLGKLVKRRPVQSLLVAAGIGAALGMLLRGGRRS